jgi:hypothetical protein
MLPCNARPQLSLATSTRKFLVRWTSDTWVFVDSDACSTVYTWIRPTNGDVIEKARADPFTFDEELSKMSTSKIILRWNSVEFESSVRAGRAKVWTRIPGRRKKSKT